MPPRKKKLTFYKQLPFCDVCQHHIYDMEKHIKSEGHKRIKKQKERRRMAEVEGISVI